MDTLLCNLTIPNNYKNYLECLLEEFDNIENLQKVILFGSLVKKRVHKNSDIDLAVYIKKSEIENIKEFKRDLINRLEDCLANIFNSYPDIDIYIIDMEETDHTTKETQNKIIKGGMLIYEKSI